QVLHSTPRLQQVAVVFREGVADLPGGVHPFAGGARRKVIDGAQTRAVPRREWSAPVATRAQSELTHVDSKAVARDRRYEFEPIAQDRHVGKRPMLVHGAMCLAPLQAERVAAGFLREFDGRRVERLAGKLGAGLVTFGRVAIVAPVARARRATQNLQSGPCKF